MAHLAGGPLRRPQIPPLQGALTLAAADLAAFEDFGLESTWNRWRAQYGGMKADEAKRLRQLETENARLKKLLAEAELDKAMLKELAEGNF